MLRFMTLLVLVLAGETAFSAGNTVCIAAANEHLDSYGFKLAADGRPFRFDDNGKIAISPKEKNVTRFTLGHAETLNVKVRLPKDLNAMPWVLVPVEKSVVVTRDDQGRLTSITTKLAPDSKFSFDARIKEISYPATIQSLESNFTYDDKGNCSFNQYLGTEIQAPGKPSEKKVYYDKTLCDKVMPLIEKLGSRKSNVCLQLMTDAHIAFIERNKQLATEKKSMKEFHPFGIAADERSYPTTFNVAAAVQSCLLGIPHAGDTNPDPQGVNLEAPTSPVQ